MATIDDIKKFYLKTKKKARQICIFQLYSKFLIILILHNQTGCAVKMHEFVMG
jgi:hypothetical protein